MCLCLNLQDITVFYSNVNHFRLVLWCIKIPTNARPPWETTWGRFYFEAKLYILTTTLTCRYWYYWAHSSLCTTGPTVMVDLLLLINKNSLTKVLTWTCTVLYENNKVTGSCLCWLDYGLTVTVTQNMSTVQGVTTYLVCVMVADLWWFVSWPKEGITGEKAVMSQGGSDGLHDSI